MAINPATVGTSAYELLDGSLSSFYADVDEAIAASEVVKGQYRHTINPAYNSPNPVDSNSFTTVGLTQSGPMVVDLENSYISTVAHCTIKLDEALKKTFANIKETPISYAENSGEFFFVGWKRSIEAIERYDILVNSTPIYTQSFCGEESFVMGQVQNDMVTKNSPYIYTNYENVQIMSPNVCGVYVFFKYGEENTGFQVEIPIKIPISDFPMLKDMKYLLSWMGKWEIRLYFSMQNMVFCKINSDVAGQYFAPPAADKTLTTCFTSFNPDGTSDLSFIQMNEKRIRFLGGINPQDKDNLTNSTEYYAFQPVTMTLKDVSMNTAQFQIRIDVLEMLKQKYLMEKPLTFPVSTIQVARFTGPPSNATVSTGGNALSIVLCQAINNCDTMFVLPFNNSYCHTVCRNPHIQELQLHAGEYGTYPNQPFNTTQSWKSDNIRFINSIMDALNVNGSELTSYNDDVGMTFFPRPSVFAMGKVSDGPAEYQFNPNAVAIRDDSEFFMAFPFSTDDDFQGGMSSPSSNINFKLTGTFGADKIEMSTPWVAAFLIDGVLMIRPDPGSDAAKVIWSDRTVC